jgi:hypothetical protein
VKKSACRLLVGKPVRKRTIGRPMCRWEDKDNNKTDFKDVGSQVVDCSDLAQDEDKRREIVNAVVNVPVLQNT